MKFRSLLALTLVSAFVAGCGGNSSDDDGGTPPTVITPDPIVEPAIPVVVVPEPVEIVTDPIVGVPVDPVEEPVVPVIPPDPVGPTLPAGSLFQITEGQTLSVSVVLDPIENIELIFPSEFDADNVTANINYANGAANIDIELGYDVAPIQTQERMMVITGNQDDILVSVDVPFTVNPTSAPDIYLLIGQSNMVGFPGDVKQDFEGGPDATDPRILQLNVTSNDQQFFMVADDFSSESNNVGDPAIITAENPLHRQNKSGLSIGLGLDFAKSALNDTTANIVLVPAAYSSSAFCAGTGPLGAWNGLPTSDPLLGNTWMFDRAVMRANVAIRETGGILRGILWHQGESDSADAGFTGCAELYADNLDTMIDQLRLQINSDVAGDHLDVPFVAGTLSRGGEFADQSGPRLIVDTVLKNITQLDSMAGIVNNDDLIPENGFPCSVNNTECIHFGAEALREMGRRYYSVLSEVVR